MRLHATEAEVQKAILELLAAYNIVAGRLNTGAGFIAGRPIWHHSYGRGCADIQAFIQKRIELDVRANRNGLCRTDLFQILWIECKNGRGGVQSLEQRTFQEYVEARGQYYLLADSPDVVTAWLKEHGIIGC